MAAASMDEDISGYDKKPSWDVAVRYQDLKRMLAIPDKEKSKLQKRAIEGILQQARAVIGNVMKPEKNKTVSWQEFQSIGQRGEIDLDQTVEEIVGSGQKFKDIQDIQNKLRFNAKEEKHQDVAILLDASLSMNGEKLALLAVATAVVAFCVPMERLAVIAFSSQTKVIKDFGAILTIEALIKKVLEIPTMGLTNLENVLIETNKLQKLRNRSNANVILVSDGKYTEGKDPTYLANRFRKLHALKLGRDIAGRPLMMDLVKLGNGKFFEVRRMKDLPRVMYAAVRTVLR